MLSNAEIDHEIDKRQREIEELRRKKFENAICDAKRITDSWPNWKRELADQVLKPSR